MRHIAERAGVTEATVSMALANNPRISAGTRLRIQELARTLNYQPNPYVSALMRTRRQGRLLNDRPILALVSCFASPDGWRRAPDSPTVRQMREGAIERAAERGYQAQEFWLHQDGMSPERFSEVLHTRAIGGLLLSPGAVGAPPPALKWEYFSTVSLSVPSPTYTLTTVCNDHFFSSLQVARECFRRGYRRPGLVVLNSHRARFQGRWEAGVLIAQREHPELQPVDPLLLESWSDAPGALKAWITRERPDVVISPSAEALRPAIEHAGHAVPGDVGLVSLACSASDSPCSGIFQNGKLIGATAIDVLIGMVERHERGLPDQGTTLMVEGVWNPGSTLRAPMNGVRG
jgi:DNA-binding LacI/PurR family transcriptional regulator